MGCAVITPLDWHCAKFSTGSNNLSKKRAISNPPGTAAD